MVRPLALVAFLVLAAACGDAPADDPSAQDVPRSSADTPMEAVAEGDAFYEMRVYHPAPGRLDDLLTRFRDHTTALFERHGMTNVGYWVPADTSDARLVYLLSYPDREARERAWAAFSADPDWTAAFEASRTDGPLVERVESTFLTPTDFSALR